MCSRQRDSHGRVACLRRHGPDCREWSGGAHLATQLASRLAPQFCRVARFLSAQYRYQNGKKSKMGHVYQMAIKCTNIFLSKAQKYTTVRVWYADIPSGNTGVFVFCRVRNDSVSYENLNMHRICQPDLFTYQRKRMLLLARKIGLETSWVIFFHKIFRSP
jgi:hypothetical protein